MLSLVSLPPRCRNLDSELLPSHLLLLSHLDKELRTYDTCRSINTVTEQILIPSLFLKDQPSDITT